MDLVVRLFPYLPFKSFKSTWTNVCKVLSDMAISLKLGNNLFLIMIMQYYLKLQNSY